MFNRNIERKEHMKMEELTSCKTAIENCKVSGTFAIAHLYKEEKAMDMHIHDCYEIYYSICGGKQFLIDNCFYTIAPGDLFIINQYESHKLTQIDNSVHDRIVLSVAPDFMKQISTEQTDLSFCFTHRSTPFSHNITEYAAFMELMVMLNTLFVRNTEQTSTGENTADAAEYKDSSYRYNHQVDDILTFINQNISQPITIEQLAGQFYLSESYICRIFKSATGTTINKYITARRISIAKAVLNENGNVMEAFERSGFTDYSNFFKAFTKAVGISPKKYASLSVS